MNAWLGVALRALQRHGMNLTYTSITRVVDESTGGAVSTPVEYTLRIYPKHIQANQYNYPTLVGKDVVMFYLANNTLTFTPKVSDTITYNGAVYRIASFQNHVASGEVVLYRMLAVKG